jgi:peptidoglycan/LPS O-acetylase OafA/YrhL
VSAIDGLRGLLAMVVVAWHVCAPFGLAWMLVPADVAVGLFFVMSGYVLTRGWDGRIGVFLIRRFVRLWPVYALCLGAGYAIAGRHPVWSQWLWYPLIGANDRAAIDPPIWSLFLEAWTMPLMPVIVWAGSAGLTRAAAAIVALALTGVIVHEAFVPALFVCGAFLARIDLSNRFLESTLAQGLGRISYSLYLSHALVLILAVRAFGPWGGVAATPAAVVVGWLVWRTIERPSITASRAVGRLTGRLFAGFGQGKVAPAA